MRKAGVGAAAVVLLAVLMVLAVSSWSRQPAVAKPSVQPIAFPHIVHVQTYKIDCQYCHADARRSEYAGLPSVDRCMGCHKIAGADKPEIKKLAEYAAKRESGRLGALRAALIPAGAWAKWDRDRLAQTGGSPEQYKHPCLVGDLKFRESMAVVREVGAL